MTIYDLKPKFQNLLRPLCQKLANQGVTANTITIASIVLSFIGGVCVFFAKSSLTLLWFVPLVLFLRMALNAIDGMLAREHNMKSPEGAILNELGDVVSDAFLYLPFAYLSKVSPELIVILIIASLIVEMTGVVAIQIGASRRYDGPFGKSDRAFIFGLIALLLAVGIPSGAWLNLLLIICIALSVFTTIKRAKNALNELKEKQG